MTVLGIMVGILMGVKVIPWEPGLGAILLLAGAEALGRGIVRRK